jgi:hypothetical protein
VQRHRQRNSSIVLTGKAALCGIGIGGLIAAAIFWWPVQSDLTSNQVVAAAYTAGLVLAPPALWSFLFPWSPGGMLLMRIQARTIGLYIVGAAAAYFLYYSVQLQWAWWAAQPIVATTGMVGYQVGVGVLLYIVIPGLVWTPISGDDLYEQVQQDQLVKRYEMQTRADIAILDAQLLRAQQLATVGMANLLAGEREELAATMRGLITGMDTTLQRIAGNLNEAAETVYGRHARGMFSAPPFAEDLAGMLEYISTSLQGVQLQERAEAKAIADDERTIPLPAGEAGRHGAASAAMPAGRQAPSPPSPRQSAAVCRSSPQPPKYAAEYERVLRELRRPFSAADLAVAIGKSERTAREVIRAWHNAELVYPSDDLKNTWYFAEDESEAGR